MDLPKTTAFVSGANRGLGKHLADQLTSRGAGVQYGDARAYLTATRAAAAEAYGLNRYLVTAFPATAAPPCSTCRTNSLTRAIAGAWPRAARLTRRDRHEPQRMGAAGPRPARC